MSKRVCGWTGKSLDGFHGNRINHPDSAGVRKKINNKKRYNQIKELDKLALSLNRMLEAYYLISNGTEGIDKTAFPGFAWDFARKISPPGMLNSSQPIVWILDYGYSHADKNKKIIIYHDPKDI